MNDETTTTAGPMDETPVPEATPAPAPAPAETKPAMPTVGQTVKYFVQPGDPVYMPGMSVAAKVTTVHNVEAVDLEVSWVGPCPPVISWAVASAFLGGSRVPEGSPGSWSW